MSKFKASTRLTEINAEQVEQIRREYNQISVSKFSLSEAFKQYALHNRNYVVIAKNCHFEDFCKYNQILANLHTNFSQVKSTNPETNSIINATLRNLIKMKLDVSRLRFKTLEIKTTIKPNFEPVIKFSLFDDSHSERKKQYTISFTQKESAAYKARFPSQDFSKLLCSFFNDFSVYEKDFTNSSITLATNEKLLQCGDYLNSYVTKNNNDEKLIIGYLNFIKSWSDHHRKIINGSADLIAFIDGAK